MIVYTYSRENHPYDGYINIVKYLFFSWNHCIYPEWVNKQMDTDIRSIGDIPLISSSSNKTHKIVNN